VTPTRWLRAFTRASVAVGTIVLLLALAACTGHSRDAESIALVPQPPGDLKGTEWLLVATGEVDAVPVGRALTLEFGDGTASGRGPCNTFRMKFVLGGTDDEDVTTGPIVSTRIACAPRVLHAEERYLRDLEAVDTAVKQDERLVLTGPNDVRLAFERIDDD
jgi:heat shock protein HslJ